MEAGPPDRRHISHGVGKSVLRKNHIAGEELKNQQQPDRALPPGRAEGDRHVNIVTALWSMFEGSDRGFRSHSWEMHGRLRSVGSGLVLRCQPPITAFLNREKKR